MWGHPSSRDGHRHIQRAKVGYGYASQLQDMLHSSLLAHHVGLLFKASTPTC
jgi:hypothetical protein